MSYEKRAPKLMTKYPSISDLEKKSEKASAFCCLGIFADGYRTGGSFEAKPGETGSNYFPAGFYERGNFAEY